MLRTRVIPCLLLSNTSLVKTIQFKSPNYVGDAINIVKIFNEKEVDELIFLDVFASKLGLPPKFDLIQKIASECFMPFTYGGGIKTMAQVDTLFQLGIEKIAINSSLRDTVLLSNIIKQYGSQSLVGSMDVKKDFWGRYRVYDYISGKYRKEDPVKQAVMLEELGIGEILLTSVDREGTMTGYDIELLKKISSQIHVPLIASGGACHINDFKPAVEAGASALAIGSMVVYQGRNRAVLTKFPKREELEQALIK